MKINLIIFILLALPLHAQYQELTLPQKQVVTGIAFRTPHEGLITTADSTVYRVSLIKNQPPQFTELKIHDRFAPHFQGSLPFWINDSTFGLVRTFWDDQACGGHRIVISYDSGQTFRSVYETIDHFQIQKIVVQSDSVLFCGVTSDIANSIDIIRCVHSPVNSDRTSYYFWGNIYPDFILLDAENILISSSNDSLFNFNYKTDSLSAFKTNLENSEFYPLFFHIEKGPDTEILGICEEGIYRSPDAGLNWNLVLPGENFRSVRPEGHGAWWAVQDGDQERRLWLSTDAGLTWKNIFNVGEYQILMDVTYPNWFWLASYAIKGKILYGQWDPSGIAARPICPADEFQLLPAYPNPCNPATTITYRLPEPGGVQIVIFNLQGQFVHEFTGERQTAGWHQLRWDGRDRFGFPVTSGIYFIRLSFAAKQMATQKILLIK